MEHIFPISRSHLEKKLLTGVLSFVMCLGEDFVKNKNKNRVWYFEQDLLPECHLLQFYLTLSQFWCFFLQFNMKY